MDLHWTTNETDTWRHLFVGCQPSAVAWMRKRKKWWEGFINLPWQTEDGINKDLEIPNYAPEKEMRTAIEAAVSCFFNLANTDRPATDKY